MIKVSVMYPNSSDVRFDIDYYCDNHMPLVKRLLGDALKGSSVDYGLASGVPGEAAPYVAIGHLVFDSIESFQIAFAPHMEEVTLDIPKYTNAEAIIQISDIKQ